MKDEIFFALDRILDHVEGDIKACLDIEDADVRQLHDQLKIDCDLVDHWLGGFSVDDQKTVEAVTHTVHHLDFIFERVAPEHVRLHVKGPDCRDAIPFEVHAETFASLDELRQLSRILQGVINALELKEPLSETMWLYELEME
jgi:hypothetical protein